MAMPLFGLSRAIRMTIDFKWQQFCNIDTMQPYKNSNRDTGVIAYETGDNGIAVKFRDGSVYLYTIKSAGQAAINEMKNLAKKGSGLTTYINQNVKERYEKKITLQ
jgi:hypothetical protein